MRSRAAGRFGRWGWLAGRRELLAGHYCSSSAMVRRMTRKRVAVFCPAEGGWDVRPLIRITVGRSL